MCFTLVQSSSAPVPWAPPVSCPSYAAAPLPAAAVSGLPRAEPTRGSPSNRAAREQGCPCPAPAAPRRRPPAPSFAHAASSRSAALPVAWCAAHLETRSGHGQQRARPGASAVPGPGTATRSFRRQPAEDTCFLRKEFANLRNWVRQSERGKDSGLGHTWALEQQETRLSQAASQLWWWWLFPPPFMRSSRCACNTL